MISFSVEISTCLLFLMLLNTNWKELIFSRAPCYCASEIMAAFDEWREGFCLFCMLYLVSKSDRVVFLMSICMYEHMSIHAILADKTYLPAQQYLCCEIPACRGAKQQILGCNSSVLKYTHVYSMCAILQCYEFLCFLTSVAGALGNAHPWDTLQRPGRPTGGLACGWEKWGTSTNLPLLWASFLGLICVWWHLYIFVAESYEKINTAFKPVC